MRHALTLSIAGTAVLLMAATRLQACDTPVYQYAMYSWQPDPYHVYYFYRAGEAPGRDTAANELLAAGGSGHNANVLFHAVAVQADGTVARNYERVWRGHRAGDLPLHVVSSGRAELFSGRLDLQAATQLLESPKRTELAGELSSGTAGALLVLADRTAGDAENALAVARRAAAAESDGERRVAVVTVQRDDPTERWLVRQLLSIEDDLPQIRGSMVFGVFGRGHALPPYIGGGVTVAGLRDLIQFMHGPCACELKVSNPGIDLLMSWNWTERLPQWATGQAVEPSFILFSFADDAGEDAEEEAAPAEEDVPGLRSPGPPVTQAPDQSPAVREPQASGNRPVTDASDTPTGRQVEPDPEPAAVPPGPAQPELPTTTEARAKEQAEPVQAPAQREGPAERAGVAATGTAGDAAPAGAREPEAQEPPHDRAQPDAAPSAGLVRRVPELPGASPARMRLEADAELMDDGGVATVLLARIGVVLVLVAMLSAIGAAVLLRRQSADGA